MNRNKVGKLLFSNKFLESEFSNIEIVEGSSGSGKTKYVVDKSVEMIEEKKSVLYFSVEDKSESILMRIVEVLDSNRIDEEQLVHNYSEELLLESNFRFYNPELTVEYIVNKINEEVNNNKVDLVVIDSIGLLEEFGYGKDESSKEETYKMLDEIAVDNNFRLVLTKALNRSELHLVE